MFRLSRRAFLAWVCAAASAPANVHASSVSLEEFLRLSRRLTGRKTLDARVAAIYLDAILAAPGNSIVLSKLVRASPGPNKSAAELAIEESIIESWYTGIFELNGQRRVATLPDALVWDAIGVSAAGTCAGEFGAWSKAPQRKA